MTYAKYREELLEMGYREFATSYPILFVKPVSNDTISVYIVSPELYDTDGTQITNGNAIGFWVYRQSLVNFLRGIGEENETMGE